MNLSVYSNRITSSWKVKETTIVIVIVDFWLWWWSHLPLLFIYIFISFHSIHIIISTCIIPTLHSIILLHLLIFSFIDWLICMFVLPWLVLEISAAAAAEALTLRLLRLWSHMACLPPPVASCSATTLEFQVPTSSFSVCLTFIWSLIAILSRNSSNTLKLKSLLIIVESSLKFSAKFKVPCVPVFIYQQLACY